MTHTRKRLALLAAVCTAFILTATADSGFDMKPLKLEVPEIKPELVDVRTDKSFSYTAPTAGPDLDFLKSKTNPGTKAYRVMDDLTFVGVPLFAAGWAIKGDKAMFRVNNKNGKKNTQLLTDFKTGIDDYTQFFGPVMTVGLKLGGVDSFHVHEAESGEQVLDEAALVGRLAGQGNERFLPRMIPPLGVFVEGNRFGYWLPIEIVHTGGFLPLL